MRFMTLAESIAETCEAELAQMSSIEIVNPKRDPRHSNQWDAYFPYYAGYPERFASTILGSLDLNKGGLVLDPWNGSGTTPYAAARLGFDSIGLDINPAMAIVAKARLLPSTEASALVPLGNQVVASCVPGFAIGKDDPLGIWFGPKTASYLRSIECGIRQLLIGRQLKSEVEIGSVSCIASALYVALFSVARLLAGRFKGSNPTWLRSPGKDEPRVAASKAAIEGFFLAQLQGMSVALSNLPGDCRDSTSEIGYADSTCLPIQDAMVDAVLTSPPYCTRIDYATTTRFELAVLDGLMPSCHVELGRRMLGSVRVPRYSISVGSHWGDACQSFLNAVANHASKASAGYYLKTHLDYFDKLDRSLGELSRVLKLGGAAVFVVQDSFYKEVHNDVPRIVAEMAASHGFTLRQRKDFPLKRSMASINKKSKMYRNRSDGVESVLCFLKE